MTTVAQNRQGPIWPLGFIQVTTPGTPVAIDSLVDPTGKYHSTSPASEYTNRANAIWFQAVIPANGASPSKNTTGNVYVVMQSGSRNDSGTIILTLVPGGSLILDASAFRLNVFALEWFFVDADNALDGLQVTAFIA